VRKSAKGMKTLRLLFVRLKEGNSESFRIKLTPFAAGSLGCIEKNKERGTVEPSRRGPGEKAEKQKPVSSTRSQGKKAVRKEGRTGDEEDAGGPDGNFASRWRTQKGYRAPTDS